MKIEDAYEKLSESELLFKNSKYAGALLSMQQCLELSIKALLDKLKINYRQADPLDN
jgi:HEPN domain-containing protein